MKEICPMEITKIHGTAILRNLGAGELLVGRGSRSPALRHIWDTVRGHNVRGCALIHDRGGKRMTRHFAPAVGFRAGGQGFRTQEKLLTVGRELSSL